MNSHHFESGIYIIITINLHINIRNKIVVKNTYINNKQLIMYVR
jgi:hypothetical protein